MSQASYPTIPAPIEKSWIDRHPGWKIFFGALFLAGLLVLFVCGVGGAVEYSFTHSDVYRMALERAQANPETVARLGESIHAGWVWDGTINIHNSDGYAKMAIPVSGSRGSGKIHLVARKRSGIWSFSHLDVETNPGAESIDLLRPGTDELK
jgi:hypothetical protein